MVMLPAWTIGILVTVSKLRACSCACVAAVMLQSRASKPSMTIVDTPLTSGVPELGPYHSETTLLPLRLKSETPLMLLPRMTMLLAAVPMSVTAS